MIEIKDNNSIDIISNDSDNEYNINQVFKDKDEKESNENDINITDSMIEEEERMQLENQVEDEKEQQEIRRKQEEAFQDKEESKQRLNFLLKKVGIFSEWLALKLEQNQNQQLNAQKKSEASRKRKEQMENIEDNSLTNNNEFENRLKRRRHSQKQKRIKKTNQEEKKIKKLTEQDKEIEINKENESNNNNNTKANDIDSIKEKNNLNRRQPALLTGGTLRKYQVEGVEWLISLYDNGLNGILADEMGLGKTIQVIAFLAYLKEKEIHGPYLIVSPLSTLSNWVAEIRKFAPSLPAILYHGTIEERANIRKRKMKKVDENFPIIITSYEIVINDKKFLSKYNWKYIIVDEGHRLKNYNCKLFRELKLYKTDNRLLLTGTPLQNNLSELWSLLNFLLPSIFDDLDLFQSWFDFSDLNNEGGESRILDQEEKESVITNLHHILKPFLLRRLKTEVEKELPKKREYLLTAPLTQKQIDYYRAALGGHEALRNELLKKFNVPIENKPKENESGYHDTRRNNSVTNYGDDNLTDNKYFKKLLQDNNTDTNTNTTNTTKNVDESKKAVNKIKHLKLQNLLMQLRKICNHPYLMTYDEEESFPEKEKDLKEGELPDIVASSGKMIMLYRLLPALIKENHKVLIFSQMTRMMDILEEWFENYLKITYSRIDGSIPLDQREIEIKKFKNDPDCRVFLLSTRAGGLGINLTAADTVIIYDSDWNPQMDLQAQDRCHRIGQTKPVIVYRLVSSGSAEKKILEKANAKKKLEKLVIQKGNFKGNKGALTSKNTITIKELADILYIDESEIVIGDTSASQSGKGKITPESILSDEDLKLILDRSDEAFEISKKSHSQPNHKYYNIIEESRDETNDALARM